MKSMKIGINARALSENQPTGAAQMGIQLIQEMEKIDEVELVLFGSSSLAKYFDHVSICDKYFPSSQEIGLLWEQIFLPYLAKKKKIDVLYCPTGNGPLRDLDMPVVVCIHDLFAYQGGNAPMYYHLLQKFRVPKMIECGEHITTVSKYTQDQIYSEFNTNREKMTTVYNGINKEYLDPVENFDMSLPSDYLLFVGSPSTRKNTDKLVESFKILKEKYNSDINLVFVGPSDKVFYDESTLTNNSKSIKHLGYMDVEKLKYVYANAEVFVFPTLAEGFGLPPLEAMAMGTPVVASNRPCLPEVLGDAAVFCDPADEEDIAKKINQVLESQDLKNDLIAKGKGRVNKYSWEKAAKETINVLEQVLR